MEEKKRFKVVTLGCRTNQYESQAYHDQLLQMGYEQAAEGESADVCIVQHMHGYRVGRLALQA